MKRKNSVTGSSTVDGNDDTEVEDLQEIKNIVKNMKTPYHPDRKHFLNMLGEVWSVLRMILVFLL